MKIRSFAPVFLALAVVAALGSVGCGKHNGGPGLLSNQRPEVRLTYAPIDTSHAEFYVYKMNWSGYDPDGRVVRFQYVVDPPSVVDQDTLWETTTRNEQTITFRAAAPDSATLGGVQPRSEGFHVFVIRAVDNGGLYSEPVARAFFSFGVAPVVNILSPKPTRLMSPQVPPSVKITWVGKDFIDPNGFVFEKPLKYKYKLLSASDPTVPWNDILRDPSVIRTKYAPLFPGWDSCGAETTSVTFTNLVPNKDYLFVVVAFGRSGAYSPIFSLDGNVLRMTVGYAGVAGPRLTLYNSFFSYTYNGSGGFDLPASWAINIEAPGGQDLTFNWFATETIAGVPVDIRAYRWALDLNSLDNEAPRSDQNDWYHWSPWEGGLTRCVIGPFPGSAEGELHNLYVEAEDVNGFRTVGWVRFLVYQPSFDHDLLIVDDTRFSSDQIVTGRPDSLKAPSGNWPNRAELDSFLFARGGARWRMTPPLYAGGPQRLSWPGIFNGYSYDTLDTRRGLENPTVSLSLIGRYRHMVWFTDRSGAGLKNVNVRNPDQTTTTLRYMATPNRQNTLATWVSQGGELFACGGGFAEATESPWLQNDQQLNSPVSTRWNKTYRSDGTRPDLVPGRFLYDLAHWRSALTVGARIPGTQVRFVRFDQPDRYADSLLYPWHVWRGRPWPANAPVGAYNRLPLELQAKTTVTDSVWPFRTSGSGSMNFGSAAAYDMEFLVNNMATDFPENPDGIERDTVAGRPERPFLDTLYMVHGNYHDIAPNGGYKGWTALMTAYRGYENLGHVIFLGTGIWNFQRDQCVSLVDAVLNGVWGLPKNATYATRARPAVFSQPGAARSRSATWGGMQPAHQPTGSSPVIRTTVPSGRSAPAGRRSSIFQQRLR